MDWQATPSNIQKIEGTSTVLKIFDTNQVGTKSQYWL